MGDRPTTGQMGTIEIENPVEYRTYSTDSRGRITLGDEYSNEEVLVVLENVVEPDDEQQADDTS